LSNKRGDGNSILVARFSVPAKKPVLLTPTVRAKAASARKAAHSTLPDETRSESERKGGKRSMRLANKPPSNLSVEEQAIALLMKKSGILESVKAPTVTELQQFHTQFVDPMEGQVVGGMREAFGLPDGGGG